MKRQLTLIFALAALSLPAMAEFETVSRAYEVALGKMRIPTSIYSSVGFRECDECEMHTVRLTGNTRFVVNGRTVSFEKFREMAAAVNDADAVPVIVLRHLESDTITRISVSLK
ncbi:MAG: hypothetical protein QNI98_06685 [Woeseiaceae bacterium]|nr:hypothetical protein [Woeseiaceae bacterium]